jgi:hypothetical protein
MRAHLAAGALLASVLLLPVAARSAAPTPVDPDFLEFLGSVDSEGEGWSEFLRGVDIDKRAPPAQPAPPVRKPAPAAPPAKQPPKGADK